MKHGANVRATQVNDYAVWRKAYDAFETERGGFGVRGHAVFQTVREPNDITAWHDFDTIEAAQAFANSPRLKEVMQAAGVASVPDIWFANPT